MGAQILSAWRGALRGVLPSASTNITRLSKTSVGCGAGGADFPPHAVSIAASNQANTRPFIMWAAILAAGADASRHSVQIATPFRPNGVQYVRSPERSTAMVLVILLVLALF